MKISSSTIAYFDKLNIVGLYFPFRYLQLDFKNQLSYKMNFSRSFFIESNKTNIKCKEEKNAISERISAHCGQCTAGFSQTYLMENLSLKVR